MVLNDEKVLLHCCCAPCTILPLESLRDEGRKVTLLFYNPNIHPHEEYEKRLTTLRMYARDQGVSFIEGRYDPEKWEAEVGILGGPYPLIKGSEENQTMQELRKARCSACYFLRFREVLRIASDQHMDSVDTTLTISPYQFTEEVKGALDSCASLQGIPSLTTDWRSFFGEATRRSRALGMYRQNYCGCRFSLLEAERERTFRRNTKKEHKRQNS